MGFQVTGLARLNARWRQRLLLLTFLTVAASTQSGRALGADADAANPKSPDFSISVGPGIYVSPSYPGASGSRRLWFPFIDAEYANLLYTSASDLLGVYARKTENTQIGAAIEYDPTRRDISDDPRLRGLPNVSDTLRFKLFGSQTISFVTGDANVARDIEGHRQGTLAQANLWLTAPFAPNFSISVGPGIAWADSQYTHTFYAVTRQQAANSRLPAFATHSGVLDAHLNALTEWIIRSKIRVGAEAYLARLESDAADSPITLRRRQLTVTGWIAYRFH